MINNKLLVVRHKRLGCLPVAFTVAIAVTVGLFFFGSCPSPNRVYLSAPPTSNQVQMFERVSADNSGTSHFFPDRTACTVANPRTAYNVAGISMEFYKLTCNGVTGYVNAKWVSRY